MENDRTHKTMADIREWTSKTLPAEERAKSLEVSRNIIKIADQAIKDGKTILVANTGNHYMIIGPHGGGGYEKTQMIIDLFDRDPYNEDSNRIASYLFFPDVVINRPNFWGATKTLLPDESVKIEIIKNNVEGSDNYEVGNEELDLLYVELIKILERKTVTAPSGKVIDISSMEPNSQRFVENVYARITPDFSKTEYGHAAMSLATSAIAQDSMEKDQIVQAEYLKKCALGTIKKFGPKIIPLLRDELRLAITDEDIASIDF